MHLLTDYVVIKLKVSEREIFIKRILVVVFFFLQVHLILYNFENRRNKKRNILLIWVCEINTEKNIEIKRKDTGKVMKNFKCKQKKSK